MAVEVQDILSIDAVFAEFELLRNNDEVAACSAALGSEIITEVGWSLSRLEVLRARGADCRCRGTACAWRPLPTGRGWYGSTLLISTMWRQSSGWRGRRLTARICKERFLLLSVSTWNLVYDQDSGEAALAYLGRPCLSVRVICTKTGGTQADPANWSCAEGTWQWTFKLEPRFRPPIRQRCSLVRISMSRAAMPDDGDMEMLLRELWGRPMT